MELLSNLRVEVRSDEIDVAVELLYYLAYLVRLFFTQVTLFLFCLLPSPIELVDTV